MAKQVMGILGGFSGRVGTVVGYHRRGRWFVRAYRAHIQDRKSDAQLAQRSRFKAMIRFASPATPVLRVGLRREAVRLAMTEGNVFLRLNKGCFSEGVEYARLRFSRGRLAAVRGLRWREDGGVLRVRWSGEGGRLSDRVHLYVYCPALSSGLALEGWRGARHVEALLPEGFAGAELHVWAFASNCGGEVSETTYGLESDPAEGSQSISSVFRLPHHQCAGVDELGAGRQAQPVLPGGHAVQGEGAGGGAVGGRSYRLCQHLLPQGAGQQQCGARQDGGQAAGHLGLPCGGVGADRQDGAQARVEDEGVAAAGVERG